MRCHGFHLIVGYIEYIALPARTAHETCDPPPPPHHYTIQLPLQLPSLLSRALTHPCPLINNARPSIHEHRNERFHPPRQLHLDYLPIARLPPCHAP